VGFTVVEAAAADLLGRDPPVAGAGTGLAGQAGILGEEGAEEVSKVLSMHLK